MTPADLAAVGRLLYGGDWQSPMARALGVRLRRLTRWAAAVHRIPPEIGPALAGLLDKRAQEYAVLPGACRRMARRLRGRNSEKFNG